LQDPSIATGGVELPLPLPLRKGGVELPLPPFWRSSRL